jgi:hypothetical protein
LGVTEDQMTDAEIEEIIYKEYLEYYITTD